MAIQLKHGEKFQPFTCSSYLWTDGQKGQFHMVPIPRCFRDGDDEEGIQFILGALPVPLIYQ